MKTTDPRRGWRYEEIECVSIVPDPKYMARAREQQRIAGAGYWLGVALIAAGTVTKLHLTSFPGTD